MNKLNFLKNKKNKKGFTLIELIVVMAVIGILVLLAAPKFLGYTKDANVTAMQADAKILSNAGLMYNIDKESFPVKYTDANTNLKYDLGEEKVVTVANASDLEKYLKIVDPAYTSATVKLAEIDGTLLTSYIKNTKNPVVNYAIVMSGPMQGDVVSIAGVQDKAGKLQFGVAKQ